MSNTIIVKKVSIRDIFDEITISKSHDFCCLNAGNTLFVGRGNNSSLTYIDSTDCYVNKGKCITIGMVGTFIPFWRDNDFVASQNILILRSKYLNKYNAMYIITLLKQCIKNKFSYNRPIQKTKFLNLSITIPINKISQKIDWQFMEDYVRSLKINLPVTSNKSFNISFDFSRWSFFKLSDLFKIKKGKRLTKIDQTVGNTPYIGAIDTNNGLSNTIGQKPIHKGNTISLSYNGSVGEAFFQPVDFWATDDVNVLYPKFKMNQYIALFICTILRKEKIKYSYGRKWTLEQMNSTRIKLPSIDGSPNWQFMEDYIKSLPYGDCL